MKNWTKSVWVLALCLAGCNRMIDARPVRVIPPTELSKYLPAHFEENEDAGGKLMGVAIDIDGYDLKQLGGGSRNPVARFVKCQDGSDLGHSFGPFVGRDYLTSYVRKNKVRNHASYVLIATAPLWLRERPDACLQLEARSYIGIVAQSERLPLLQ